MRIIILGATGQIGKVLFDGLKLQYNVTGTSRKKVSGLFQFDPFKDNWNILGATDILINCVGLIYESEEISFEKVHIGLTELIIKNRITIGNPRIIQISALGASEKHHVNFLRTKGIADKYLSVFPDTIIVRPSIVCTHKTMLVRKLLLLYSVSNYLFGLVCLPENFKEHKLQPVMPQDLVAIVEGLCKEENISSFIDIVGPDELSFQELINDMFRLNARNYKILELPQWVFSPLVRIIDKIDKRIISREQYQLLFSDNISDKTLAEKYLKKPLTPTDTFWMSELKIPVS